MAESRFLVPATRGKRARLPWILPLLPCTASGLELPAGRQSLSALAIFDAQGRLGHLGIEPE